MRAADFRSSDLVRFVHNGGMMARACARAAGVERKGVMIEPASLINAIFAGIAVIFGLGSRNLATAAVAGTVVGLVHAVLLAMIAAKSGIAAVGELAYLGGGADLFLQEVRLTFTHARFVVYLAVTFFALLAIMILAYLVACGLTAIVKRAMPCGSAA
jgi:hypothetical protein